METGIALVALYLRGLVRAAQPPRRKWRAVDHVLRLRESVTSVELALERAGLWLEASALRTPGLASLAESLWRRGRAIAITDEGYPPLWRRLEFAPPAVWRSGAVDVLPSEAPWRAIVGSRHLSREARRFAREAGFAVAESGGIVLSGGALGADREAARGALAWARELGADPPLAEVVPCGIARWEGARSGVLFSLAAPEEPFSTALAMERNALLYGGAERALVVAARLREGGAWAGATDALRRRLTRVMVRADGSPAMRALRALGAEPLVEAAAFPQIEVRAESLLPGLA